MMSVIFFDADELGAVAKAAVNGSLASDEGKTNLRHYAECLAIFSAANAKAYSHTYREATEPETASAIEAAAHTETFDRKHAAETAYLLHYNAVANDGTDFADNRETLRALLSVVTAFWRGRA